MVLPDYYEYINILAFKYLYKYENKKNIFIETLHAFREKLIKAILEDYEQKGNHYFPEEDQWHGKVSFEDIDVDEKLKEFLDTYEDLFYRDDDKVYLRDDITYDEIYQLEIDLRMNNKIPNRINRVEETPEVIKLLGIKTIVGIVKNYLKIEKKLYEDYNALYTNKDNAILKNEINKTLNMRALFYIKLSYLPEYTVDAFRNFDLSCDEFEITDFNPLPIDISLYNQSEYADEEDFWSDIECRIYDIYQYAIFGNEKNELTIRKLSEDLNRFYFFERPEMESAKFDLTTDYIDNIENESLNFSFDESINSESLDNGTSKNQGPSFYFFNPSDEEWVFNLCYLDKLNKYMEKYEKNESLLNTKRRLLYALDQPGKKIFIEENFEKEFANLDFDEIDEDSFNFFHDEYFFLADEVFETKEDENTVKKLLLISTYYDLTKNEEIVEIINKHKNHESYDKYFEVIFGEEKGKLMLKQK